MVCSNTNRTGLGISDIPELIKGEKFIVYRLEKTQLRRFSDLIQKLMKYNQEPGATDILILAAAMADNQCSCLLTFDGKLINNKDIGSVITSDENLRRRRFNVLSEIRV